MPRTTLISAVVAAFLVFLGVLLRGPVQILVTTAVHGEAIAATATPPPSNGAVSFVKDKSPLPTDTPAPAPSKTTAAFDGTGADASLLSTHAPATVPSDTFVANDDDKHLISFDATGPPTLRLTDPPLANAPGDNKSLILFVPAKTPTAVAPSEDDDKHLIPSASANPPTPRLAGPLPAEAFGDNKSLILFVPANTPTAVAPSDDDDKHLIPSASANTPTPRPTEPLPANALGDNKSLILFVPAKTPTAIDDNKTLMRSPRASTPTPRHAGPPSANDLSDKSLILFVPARMPTALAPAIVLAGDADDKSLVPFTPTNTPTSFPPGAQPANAAGTCKSLVPFDPANPQAPPSRPAPSTDEYFVDFDSHFILFAAEEGQCSANTPVRPSTTVPATDQYCVDVHPQCVSFAAAGKCSTNPEELARDCPRACGLCSERKSSQMNDVKQTVSGNANEMAKIMEILHKGKLHAESWVPNSSCLNYHHQCGKQAARGYCDEESIQVFCAPVCGTCDKQSRYRVLSQCNLRLQETYPDQEKRGEECRIRTIGPQLLNSTTPEPIYFDIPREGRYNEPGANVQWQQHPFVAQIFSGFGSVEPEQVVQYHCVGNIYGLSKTNSLLLWASHHCAENYEFTASSLIVRVFSESAAQQDDGCLTRVSRIYELQPREGANIRDFFLHKDNTVRRAQSDISVIELEEGQCIDSSKLALPVWDGPDGVLDSLPKNVIPPSVLNQTLRPTFESPYWYHQYKCLDGDYGELYYPSQFHTANKDLVKGLNSTLAYCGQKDSLRPTDDFETMYRFRWGWVEESGTVRMQLQAIPLAIWHHPCALGLHALRGVTQWPFKEICAEPLLDT